MNMSESLMLFILTFTLLSCQKGVPPAPAASLETEGKIEYRYKYQGVYSGTYTKWWFTQGVTTTQNTEGYLTQVTMDKTQDSVIMVANFGNFTVSALGSGSLEVGWKEYKSVKFQNDSLYYYYNNMSPLGGSQGYYLKSKKVSH